MQRIVGKTIYLTRGDSFRVKVGMKLKDGSEYIPVDGDVVRFAVKRSYSDRAPIIEKIIPNDTQILELLPSDTKPLGFGSYVYDCELTTASGDVDTFIAGASLVITEEVD